MNSVAAAYDAWADLYDHDVNATRDLDATVLRRQPLRLAGADVLELGCGTGKNTSWLAKEARQVLAFDFSEGMLAKARERVSATHVRFVKQDLETAWPVPDDSQDVVVGNLVLEHIEHLAPIFQKAHRVLRPGGQLYFCELHPLRQLRGSQARFLRGDTGQVQTVPAYLHHVSDYLDAGLASGLVLEAVSDWRDSDADEGAVPRLFSTSWRKGR